MILLSVFALSFATLGYELALARWLAISHWDTLAFIVIGIAMLGLAAGGVVWQAWAARPARPPLMHRGVEHGLAITLCLAGSATLAGSFLVAKNLPLDWLRLPADGLQIAWLAAAILVLSLPSFCSGMLSCMAYDAMAPRAGIVSAAGMAGSAAGAVAFLLLLPVLDEGRIVVILAGAALLPVVTGVLSRSAGPLRIPGAAVGLVLTLCLAAGAGLPGSRLFAITASPWQTLPQLLMLPKTRVVSERSGTWGRLTEVESPYIRFAPGLSLAATGAVPSQRGLVLDGDSLAVLYDPASVAFARETHLWAGYVLAGKGSAGVLRVLVIHGDGGIATACALASGSRAVTIVAENPGVASRLSRWYAPVGVRVVPDNPRSFLVSRAETWDLIAIEKWGPSVPGMAGLSESALLTTDALEAAWRRLTADGVLLVTRRLLVPPSDSVRVFASAVEALRSAGVAEPGEHLAVIRGTDSLTVIASPRALHGALLDSLRSFAAGLGFDLDWFPGMTEADADRFQRFDRPLFFRAFSCVLSSPGFASRYALDVAPQSDDRPFPNRFLRWTRVRDFAALAGGRISGLLLSTEVVGGAALAVSVASAAVLLALASALGVRRRAGAASSALLAACAFTGAGFILVEVCLIDAAAVLFPGPLVPFALSLGVMLGFGTFGGLASLALGDRALLPALGCLVIVLAGLRLLLVPGVHLALALAPLPRALLFAAGAGIPGFLLGLPFPLVMARLPRPRLSLAWAANGCASVVASSAAGLIAAGCGLASLCVLGAAACLAAAICVGASGVMRGHAG